MALLEDGELVELMLDRPDQGRVVGDIYLGRVEAVLPGIQAAFVDIGTDKAGFLHVSDLVQAEEDEEDADDEDGFAEDLEENEDDTSASREEAPPERRRSGGGRGRGRRGGAPSQGQDKGRGNGRNGEGKGGRSGNGGAGNGKNEGQELPRIQDHLSRGDEILVQVTKEPIGTKGPRLTSQISLPGRSLVFMPYSSHVGISRKIEERKERARLRSLAKSVLPEGDGGLIVRTVGEELDKKRLEAEFRSLHQTWKEVRARADRAEAPARVHREAKLISGLIRDLFTDKFDALVVDNKSIHRDIVESLKRIDPELRDRVRLHEDPTPLFDHYGIEEEIHKVFQRRVRLPSGGSIIVEPTEALVTIDVNTGKYTGKGKKDPEETILRTNVDAAREIARQLRLRDIGGIVVCDFIDMESEGNRERVVQELRTHLARDRARTKAFSVSELGLVEMTRQRVRPSLFQTLTQPCELCGGTGRIFTPPSVMRRVERSLVRAAASGDERDLVIRVHPDVALYALEEEPDFLKRTKERTKLGLVLRDDPLLRPDEFRLLSGPAARDVTDRYVPG